MNHESSAYREKTEYWRQDFPFLENNPSIVYFDNAATSQKPDPVLTRMREFQACSYANVHRATHSLSAAATEAYENARQKIHSFLNAPAGYHTLFCSNATSAINLVARSWAETYLTEKNVIVLTVLEHHSNIVPWLMLKKKTGVQLRFAPVEADGSFRLDKFLRLLDERVKMVCVAHVSNVLGTRLPVADIVRASESIGAVTLIDGSQAVPHFRPDIGFIAPDFYVFTGHKAYGPSGVGILCAKTERLQAMPPFLGGGEMISTVNFDEFEPAELPWKFEAGTPPITQAVGLAAALEYTEAIGRNHIQKHEMGLLEYARRGLSELKGVRIVGTASEKEPILSFLVSGAHPHDVATILDQAGIAVRAGNHCAEPLMQFMKLPGTLRASFALYNQEQEIDRMVAALHTARKMLVG